MVKTPSEHIQFSQKKANLDNLRKKVSKSDWIHINKMCYPNTIFLGNATHGHWVMVASTPMGVIELIDRADFMSTWLSQFICSRTTRI